MSNESPLPPPTSADAASTTETTVETTALGSAQPVASAPVAAPPPPASPYVAYPAYATYPAYAGYPPYPPYPPTQVPYPAYALYPGAAPLAGAAPMTYAAYQTTTGAAPTTPWATTALICSICGVIWAIPCGVLGIIFGFVALSEIKASGGRVGGRGLALAAVITGFVVVALYLTLIALYFVFIFAVLQSIPSSGMVAVTQIRLMGVMGR